MIPVDVGQASCDGLITDTRAPPMTTLAKPSRLDAAIDPEFGTRIVRVTDVASETGGEGIKPVYSTIQAWSADESYLMLYEVGSGHRLYDGHTYEFIRRLNIDPPDLEQGSAPGTAPAGAGSHRGPGTPPPRPSRGCGCWC